MPGDDIHDFVVTMEDVQEFGGFLVPNEEVAAVTAGYYEFIVEAIKVYVFDGFDVG